MELSKMHRPSNEKKSKPIAVTFDEAYNDSLNLANPIDKSIMKLNAQILRAKDDSTISIPRELQPYPEDVNLPPVFETHVNMEADLLGTHAFKPPREHAFLGFRFTEYNPKQNSFERKFIRIGFGTRDDEENNYSNIMNDTESNRVVSSYTQINYEQLKKGYNSIQPYFDKYPKYNYLSRNCNTFVKSIAGSIGLGSISKLHSTSASLAGDSILMSSMNPGIYPKTTFDVTPFSRKADPVLIKENIKSSIQVFNDNVKLKFLDDNFIEDIKEFSNIENCDITSHIQSIENLFEEFKNNLSIENAINHNKDLSMYCKRIENALRQTSQVIGTKNLDAYIEMMRYAYIFSKYSYIFTMNTLDTCNPESLLTNENVNKSSKDYLLKNIFSKSWGSDELSKLAIAILSPNPPNDDIYFHLVSAKRLNPQQLNKVFNDIERCFDKNIDSIQGALGVIQRIKGFSNQELAQYLVIVSIYPFILSRYMKAIGLTNKDPLYRLFCGMKVECPHENKTMNQVNKIESTPPTPFETVGQLSNKAEEEPEITPVSPTETNTELVEEEDDGFMDISEYTNELVKHLSEKIKNRNINNGLNLN